VETGKRLKTLLTSRYQVRSDKVLRQTGIAARLSRCAACVLILAFVMSPNLYGQAFDPFAPDKKKPAAKDNSLNTIASVEFVNTDITSIFKMLSDLTGWSIVMSPEISKQPPKINIWIKDLTPDQVLEQVVKMGGLIMERRGKTINVMSFDEYAQLYGLAKRVIPLKHADATNIQKVLETFVDKDKSHIVSDEGSNSLVLLVSPPELASFEELISRLDVPSPYAKDVVRIIRLKHLEAANIMPLLEEFLQPSENVDGTRKAGDKKSLFSATEDADGPTTRAGEGWLVKIMPETKLNALVLRGNGADVENAITLIEALDSDPGVYVEAYPLKYTDGRDVFEAIREVVEQDERTGGSSQTGVVRIRLASNEQNNRILVEGSETDHKRVKAMIEALDQPIPPGSGGTRVYKLENATSGEVAGVLQDLVAQREQDDLARQELNAQQRTLLERRTGQTTSGAGESTGAAGAAPAAGTAASTSDAGDASSTLNVGDVLPPQITDASEINAIVIRASAAEHEEFAEIIRQLDEPRDQVLLEVTIVTIRSDGSFDFGIEVSGAMVGTSATDLIGFTSFGIGAVDPATGGITLADPARIGFNFGVFNTDDFSLVLNALQTTGDVRITSAPKVLVEDNAEATISRLNQEPFESTSQSDATTETSFGGFVDAGTTLTATPHVSNDDWLRLEYAVDLSSFGTRTAEQSAANLPPPRNTNTLTGTVRIPSGHMVVLGGLVNTRDDETLDQLPLIGDIPIIGELFKNRTSSQIHETLYIFIEPVILRDPRFRDLLYLSANDIRNAKIFKESGLYNPLKMGIPTRKRKAVATNKIKVRHVDREEAATSENKTEETE